MRPPVLNWYSTIDRFIVSGTKQTTVKQLPETFHAEVYRQLKLHPDGISEYDLICALREQGYFAFMEPSPALPHELFQAHFLLFHSLYVWRDRLHATQQACLLISPLEIRQQDWNAGEAGLVAHDPLRAYYLELANLQTTSEDDVNELIAGFWRSLSRSEQRDTALRELGLVDPVSDDVIIQTYRRLAMQHHPDRGGDQQRLQSINRAYELLIKTR